MCRRKFKGNETRLLKKQEFNTIKTSRSKFVCRNKHVHTKFIKANYVGDKSSWTDVSLHAVMVVTQGKNEVPCTIPSFRLF